MGFCLFSQYYKSLVINYLQKDVFPFILRQPVNLFKYKPWYAL